MRRPSAARGRGGNDDTFAEATAKAGSLGLFIRSLVGLDRVAAKAAFAEFLDNKRYGKNQIEFAISSSTNSPTARSA